jgi:hypothetical protein
LEGIRSSGDVPFGWAQLHGHGHRDETKVKAIGVHRGEESSLTTEKVEKLRSPVRLFSTSRS